MSLRAVLGTTLVVALVAPCSKKTTAGTDAGDAATTILRPKSTLAPPPDGPCAIDDDCKLYLEPCSCRCIAHVGETPTIPPEKWSTVCSGGPPGNCGVASPCSNVVTSCDPHTKTCRVIQ